MDRRRRLRRWATLGMSALVLAAGGCAAPYYLPGLGVYPVQPPAYSAAPLSAQVRDATTGAPLEGVVVVAYWQLETGESHAGTVRQLAVQEAVTDADGRFSVPGFGLRARGAWGVLQARDPGLLVFKPGYDFRELTNDTGFSNWKPSQAVHRVSRWDGQVIELQPFEGNLNEYGLRVMDLANLIRTDIAMQQCRWLNTPLVVHALGAEGARLAAAGIPLRYRPWTPHQWSEAARALGSECLHAAATDVGHP